MFPDTNHFTKVIKMHWVYISTLNRLTILKGNRKIPTRTHTKNKISNDQNMCNNVLDFLIKQGKLLYAFSVFSHVLVLFIC